MLKNGIMPHLDGQTKQLIIDEKASVKQHIIGEKEGAKQGMMDEKESG